MGEPDPVECWMTIRVYGSLLYATGAWGKASQGGVQSSRPFTEAIIDTWMEQCADHGATTVLWQSNCGGTSTHPSPVFPLAGPPYRPHNEHWADVWEFLGQQVRRFDTLRAAVDAAHAHELRLAYAFCPCDFVDSPFEESVFHPNLWARSRDGEPLVGVPCFAEPRVRELLIEHVRDVLERGVDDLVISPFSHAQGQGIDRPRYYGFNTMMVEAYERRWGVDPVREVVGGSFWDALYGDYFTDLLRGIRERMRPGAQRLIPSTSPDGRWGWGGSGGLQIYNHWSAGGPEPETAPACSIRHDWRGWVREGIPDALLVVAPPEESVSIARSMRSESGVPTLVWRNPGGAPTPEQWSGYRDEARAVRQASVDGYILHAMVLAEWGEDCLPNLWRVLESAAGVESG